MKITLPYPPSANRYWRHYNGRTVKSREASDYIEVAGWTARAAGVRPTSKPVAVWAIFYRPRKAGDLDNRIKILLDAMEGIAYDDDRQVIELHAKLADDKDNPRVEFEVKEAT